ncbi:hypothetical protein TNCV_3489251 [Trichonephila clavipes]|nr:hypothetical protein TNCV_3489251 [Trichonephila clavipes]
MPQYEQYKRSNNEMLELYEKITAFLSTRTPLNIAGSFIRHHPEIDGREPKQLDSTPDCEPETWNVIRGVRKKPPPIPEKGRRGVR